MKQYEQPTTGRKAFKGQPLVARLDGKSFHTFTKGLKRPYDERLSKLMVDTTAALVERFQADIGYTQSDEITLIWTSSPEDAAELNFDGRLQKIETLTASFASVRFNKGLAEALPEKADESPIFDCRAYVVPNLQEAYHALLWRQQDATKNAISMAAQSFYSQKELNGKHSNELQEMIFQKGQNFNDYPFFFKRGTFVRREKVLRELTPAERSAIPEKYRPTKPVERSELKRFDAWLSKKHDPVDFLFGSKVDRENVTVYRDHSIEVVKIGEYFEYVIPAINQRDPTSWRTYDGALEAGKQYVDWLEDEAKK